MPSKNIEPGDEINYDYGTDYFKAYLKPIGCKCAAWVKKRKKKRAEARAEEKLRLKAKAERKALKKAEKLAKAKKELRQKLRLNGAKANGKSRNGMHLNGKSPSGKHLNGNSRTGVAGMKSAAAKRRAPAPAEVLRASARTSTTRFAHRFRQRRVSEIERGALNDRARCVDDEAKPPMPGEEGQAVPAAVGLDPALGKARDPACAHLFPEHGRGGDCQAVGDDGRIDLNGAILEFNRFHDGCGLDLAG